MTEEDHWPTLGLKGIITCRRAQVLTEWSLEWVECDLHILEDQHHPIDLPMMQEETRQLTQLSRCNFIQLDNIVKYLQFSTLL